MGADIVPCRGAPARQVPIKPITANSYEMGGCPACGGLDADTLVTGDDLRSAMEDLWSFHVRRLRPGTPPQRLADRTVFSQDPALRLALCGSCGLIFRNPRARGRVLEDTYAQEAADEETLLSLFRTQRDAYRPQAARLTRLIGRAGTGLEVGSYVGAFLAASADRGWGFDGRCWRGLDFVLCTTRATRSCPLPMSGRENGPRSRSGC
ncbi:hypothetical protein BH23GEM6_BH23GEM6_13030 [soil metagenome]